MSEVRQGEGRDRQREDAFEPMDPAQQLRHRLHGFKGETHRVKREIYHRTPAACILLYDPKRETVILVRQFRLPAHLTGFPGWMIEVPAGLLDGDHPDEAIRREAMEETGYPRPRRPLSLQGLHVAGCGHRDHPFLRRDRR